MPTKDTVTVSMRVNECTKNKFEAMCEAIGYSKGDAFEMLLELWERGDIFYMDGELQVAKIEEKHTDSSRIQRNLDRFVETLTDKGYPENIIADIAENILNSAREMNRFNPKRSKNDMGC